MKYTFFTILVILWSTGTFAQVRDFNNMQNAGNRNPNQNPDEQQDESQRTVIDNRDAPPVEDYRIISVRGDTTHVDTTLTIQKEFKQNYLRKDNFGLLPFSNVGESYTKLKQDFNDLRVMPKFGARGAHLNFYDVDDVYYYRVPTPWTELFFKTTFEQGQLLDASFTTNISPQLNISIAYKGLHSLGKYQHLKSSQGSFRTTVSYHTKNKRYSVNAHFLSQDLSTEQNGGLTDLANEQYRTRRPQYRDRSILDMKFTDAEGFLRPKRFFVKHHYNLIQGDSTANNQVQIGHIFNFTDEEYYYDQGTPYSKFGITLNNSGIKDFTEFQDVSNTFSAQYQNNILGKVLFKVRHTNFNYGYRRKLNLDDGVVPNRLRGNMFAVGASYEKKIGGFELSGDAMLNVTGDFDGNYLKAQAAYDIDSLNRVEAEVSTNSRQPNYNFLLYQSGYKNYNWRNELKNEQKQRLYVRLKSEKIANVQAEYNRIHNYAYFGLKDNPDANSDADTLVTPYQYDGDISYMKIKVSRKFDFWIFSLDNTLMYQKVLDGKSALHVSPFITRHSFYYRDHWFHNNLYLQTGFTLNYFSSFKADGYDPVMAEYYVQDREKIRGFPRLDFFFNAKVRTARIFFKVENLTTLFNNNGYFAAPGQPYRDWAIRVGMVWDFFL